MTNNYKPFVKKLGVNSNVLDSNFDFIESNYKNENLFNLGYHYYTKQNREKMNIQEFKERDFYLIVNDFENNITDYKEDLDFLSKNYFKKDNILSRSFYKYWELFSYFDLIGNDKKLNFACLADGDLSSMQASIYFRQKYFGSNNDNYCYLTSKGNLSECVKDFKKIKLISHITKNKNDNNLPEENGNLNDPKTIKDFSKKVSDADLIIGNAGVNGHHYLEQNLYSSLIGEILAAVMIQKKGGNLVLKIYDIYTNVTLKLVCLLTNIYNEVVLCKPLMSRPFESERFLVCIGFNLNKSESSKLSKKLMDLLTNIKKLEDNKRFLFDILTDYSVNNKFLETILEINLKIVETQHQKINKIIEYKNSGNYFGEKYHNYKDKQIEATKWWNKNFYLNSTKDLASTKKLITI